VPNLTKMERDDNIAEWIKITERVSRQVVAKPQGAVVNDREKSQGWQADERKSRK